MHSRIFVTDTIEDTNKFLGDDFEDIPLSEDDVYSMIRSVCPYADYVSEIKTGSNKYKESIEWLYSILYKTNSKDNIVYTALHDMIIAEIDVYNDLLLNFISEKNRIIKQMKEMVTSKAEISEDDLDDLQRMISGSCEFSYILGSDSFDLVSGIYALKEFKRIYKSGVKKLYVTKIFDYHF